VDVVWLLPHGRKGSKEDGMTTIAWKEGILAADSQVTADDVAYLSADKISIISTRLVIAGAGDCNECLRMEKWFKKVGTDWEKELDSKPSIKKSYEAILVSDGKPYTLFKDGYPDPLAHPFFSIGSGWKFAMAAMHLGKSATEAILLASVFDINTNDRIRYIDVTKLQGSTKAVKGRPRKGQQATSLVQAETEGGRVGVTPAAGAATTSDGGQ
jgi:ATP-dependent protease HslVU (ClpYQ) peptidase subunit